MDNFDHIEDIKSGIGSSHDTILTVSIPNKDDSEKTTSRQNPWMPKDASFSHI